MSNDEARTLFASMIGKIAPEVDLATVDQDANLQDELDLDSVDFLNLVDMIFERTGLNIAESEYEQLSSVKASIAYLAANVS